MDKYEIATAALAESQRRIEAALARAVQSGGVDGARDARGAASDARQSAEFPGQSVDSDV